MDFQGKLKMEVAHGQEEDFPHWNLCGLNNRSRLRISCTGIAKRVVGGPRGYAGNGEFF
jgi:hypothetical protein